MAKQIKVIKCPHCGSIDKTTIKEDHFRCNACNTEYFLDNDDININYNYNNKELIDNRTKKIILTAVAVIFGLFILTKIIGVLFSGTKSNSSHETRSTYTTPVEPEKEKTFYWSNTASLGFSDSEGSPWIIKAGNRYSSLGSSDREKTITLQIIDVEKEKVISTNTIEVNKTSSVDLRLFDDNNTYMIVNKSRLYQLNQASKEVVEITSEYSSKHLDLKEGIANIEFVSESNGSGFNILTNDGKRFYYYPIIDKLYTKNQVFDAQGGFNNIPKDAPIVTRFAFTYKGAGSNYPDEKLQLIKYTRKLAPGYPRDRYTFEWRDYGGSGIFTGRDPYRKVLMNDYCQRRMRLTGFKDFTPGRLYFEPKVLSNENLKLLIRFKNSLSEDALFSLQSVNTETAEVDWTLSSDQLKVRLEGLDGCRVYKDGYFLYNSNNIALISYEGKIIREFTLKN